MTSCHTLDICAVIDVQGRQVEQLLNGWMNKTLRLHERRFFDLFELHFVSGCMQSPEQGPASRLCVDGNGLHSLICRKEKLNGVRVLY